MSPKLSIIVLNWNSKDDLVSCLSHIKKNTRLKEKEIIVVDNGSTDGSVEYMKSNHPRTVLIRNEENLGVSVSRNQAIRASKGEYVLLLDVDTKVGRGAIDSLIAGMDAHPEVGMSGAKLVDPDGKLQYSCREFPTILSKFVFRRAPSKFFDEFLSKEEYRDWEHNSFAYVGYVIAACLIIRRKCLENIGVLDESFFYGPEDVDYCLRAWKAGWKVMYNPKAVVVHKEARITKKGGTLRQLKNPLFWTHVKGLVIYFWKHRYTFGRPGPFFKILD